ncbi:alcohol dehydrogenase [Shewanella sp. Choline-02u-19]|uniref:AlkA N-terminal domain-containing protein n=1 Tax=unclassified Shewanella TaxID=196818 RepID=UPI000C320359|nr:MULTISPECIES: AlkA N-terminal domain-containing protein [unclassified Shewanella]PKH63202.1 alcohol dehydrogenase [Shewanella sp. Bg11-22]PKI26967.1 alcohol dehydrogenase [Shewanella sp. Choline-02u-19]
MVDHDCTIASEICRKARLARDARFDGQFFTGVLTTGIYCRSICPAVSPKEENVRYFDSPLKAANVGLRPCLRCRPDSAPGSFAWKGVATTLERAISLIDVGVLTGADAISIEQLSERLGVSSRYLRKLFTEGVGTSIKQYAQYRQLMFAKQLLHQTELSITQIGLAAGFNSIRRFNEVFKQTLKLTPSTFRKQVISANIKLTKNSHSKINEVDVPSVEPIKLSVELYYRPPFAWQQQHDFYQVRAVSNMEWLEGDNNYGRSFTTNGVSGYFDANHNNARNSFNVDIVLDNEQGLSELSAIIANIKRVLDLDANMQAIEQVLHLLAPLQQKIIPGLRLPGTWSTFEAGCRAVLGQQVSIIQASKLLNQLVLSYGERRIISDKDVVLFPTAETVANASLDELKMPGTRKLALNALGEFVTQNPAADINDWLSIKGIGPWTVAYAHMRGASSPDVLLCGDLVVKKRVLTLYQQHNEVLESAPAIDYSALTKEIASTVSPWGSYLTFQLWNLS